MGRYISTGIIFQYRFSKMEVERQYQRLFWKEKAFSEIKQEIIDQLFPEIYDYEEDGYYLYVYLSDSVKGEDIVTTIKTYYSLIGMCNDDKEQINRVSNQIKGKTMNEIYKIAQEKFSHLFQDTELGAYGCYYAYPLVIDGKRGFYSACVSIIMIESSSAKTSTEDDLLSYNFFTDLLRYRMKPDKLADAMIVFLSP